MRSDGLFRGRGAVAEEAPRGRPHLEEAEILAVLGVGLQAGLAPRHGDGFVTVGAEDPADSRFRRRGGDCM